MNTKHPYTFLITLSLLFLCILAGCADKYMVKKQKDIQRMSDTELLSYYQGITDRTKDIDHHFRDKQGLLDPQDQEPRNRFPEPHYIGSDSYHLHQIRKMVRQEMEKRNLSLP